MNSNEYQSDLNRHSNKAAQDRHWLRLFRSGLAELDQRALHDFWVVTKEGSFARAAGQPGSRAAGELDRADHRRPGAETRAGRRVSAPIPFRATC